jgi:hypothetical protein
MGGPEGQTRPGEGATVKLGSSELTVGLAPGDSDLFVYEFNAECRISGGPLDHVSVHARLNDQLGFSGVSFLQPQSFPPNLGFCSTFGPNSVSKAWAIRLTNNTSSAISYRFSIYTTVIDFNNDNTAVGLLNDRTVRLTRYN